MFLKFVKKQGILKKLDMMHKPDARMMSISARLKVNSFRMSLTNVKKQEILKNIYKLHRPDANMNVL